MTISIVVLSLSTGFLVSPSQADQNLCPDIVLVGARGSGEQTPHQKGVSVDSSSPSQIRNYTDWMGQTIGSLYTKLITMKNTQFIPFNPENSGQNTAGKSSVAWLSYGVSKNQTNYPAVGLPKFSELGNRAKTRDYLGEVVISNSGLLRNPLREYIGRCPNSKFFLAGYSQGATIIRLSVNQLSPTEDADILEKILGVILIADPLLSPNDKRLAVGSDSRWTDTTSSCGALRLLVTFAPNCSFTQESAAINIILKSFLGYWSLSACRLKSGCANSVAVDVELAKVAKPDSTSDISRKTGVKEIVSVCYVGDAVCSPLGQRSNFAWGKTLINTPLEIHTEEYKKVPAVSAIAQWIEKRVPTKTVTSPTASAGKLIIEEWFGKGWIGSDASCVNILKIANTANKAQLKDWNTWKDMRVVALNPSTGTLLTVTASPGSGDPYTFITGNSKSTKGRWQGFDDFWDMNDAAGDYWASYGLSYKNNKFTCEKW